MCLYMDLTHSTYKATLCSTHATCTLAADPLGVQGTLIAMHEGKNCSQDSTLALLPCWQASGTCILAHMATAF